MIERYPMILIDVVEDPTTMWGYRITPRYPGYGRCDCLMKVGAICYQVGIPFPKIEEGFGITSPTMMIFQSKADAALFKLAENP